MIDSCPHCGTPVRVAGDAFCGECRGDLSESPSDAISSIPIAEPPTLEGFKSDLSMAQFTAIVMSVFFYATMMFTFAQDARKQEIAAYGKEPLGIPVGVFVGVLQTILFIPIPRALFHFTLIQRQAWREGRLNSPRILLALLLLPCSVLMLIGIFRTNLYVAAVGLRHPHLVRSQRIVYKTFAYFIAIVCLWTLLTWRTD